MQNDMWITRRQLAAHIQASERKIFEMTKDGQIPSRKFGRLVRYDLAAVQAALNALPSAARESQSAAM
jgi:excisionase family DNA binding protein